jgi:predicted dehydrogenase
MKKYRTAVIGCGSMGVLNMFEPSPYTYSFAGAIQKSGNALVALVDANETSAKTASEKLGGISFFTDYRAMLDMVKPDIVCCAAGADVNAAVINEATARGVKGVYCEKPLVLSLAEADKLAAIEQCSKTKIQVNYLRNYETFHRATLDFIRNGGIGNLQAVRTTYNGGVLAVFPHTTALLSKLFDGARSVSGVISPIENISTKDDPNIDGVIRYHFAPQKRDVSVQIIATGRGKEENNTYIYELEFIGSKARINILEDGFRVRYEEMRPARIAPSLGITHPYDTAYVPIALKNESPREFMIEGMQRLIAAIENNTATDCNVSCARDAEEIAHALAISACKNGQSIALPLEDRTHAFADARAGNTLLKQQAGIIPGK